MYPFGNDSLNIVDDLSCAAAVIACALVLHLCIRRSLAEGRHLRLSNGPMGQLADSIATALSDLYYGGGGRFTGYRAVREALVRSGFSTDSPLIGNWRHLNTALRQACELEWRAIFRGGEFIAQFDLGYVNFVKIAFRLFGVQIAALHHLYFTIVGVSAALFIVGLIGHPALLWSLCILLVMLFVTLFATAVFDEEEMVAVNERRFLSTLAVVPALHLASSLAIGQEATWLTVLPVVGQAAILAFTIVIRPAANWVIIAIGLVALSWLGITVVTHHPGSPYSGSPAVVLGYGLWIVPTLAGCLVLLIWVQTRRMHPIYASDEAIASYPKWHAAYLGLAIDAETWSKNHLPDQILKVWDKNAYLCAKAYLDQCSAQERAASKPQLDTRFCLHQMGIKWRVYETIIRRCTLDYIRANLRTMPRLYLYLKPKLYVTEIGRQIAAIRSRSLEVRRWQIQDWAVVGLLVLASVALALHGVRDGGILGPLMLASGALLVTVPIPMIWSYTPCFGLGDQVWISLYGLWMMILSALIGGLTLCLLL